MFGLFKKKHQMVLNTFFDNTGRYFNDEFLKKQCTEIVSYLDDQRFMPEFKLFQSHFATITHYMYIYEVTQSKQNEFGERYFPHFIDHMADIVRSLEINDIIKSRAYFEAFEKDNIEMYVKALNNSIFSDELKEKDLNYLYFDVFKKKRKSIKNMLNEIEIIPKYNF
tara:strand:+ start:1466 stop:1966 length:501 start_codon:yes stop_codon:yes gene_type:complete